MTLNKSIISVAAASLLAAGFSGCGSSSSSSTTTTTQPTSITATDGYVLNYSVTATYSDGNTSAQNYTTTAALTSAVTDAKIVAGGTQTAGSAVLSLAELNSTVLDNLQYVTLSQKAQSSDGTTLTYGTFFDANGDNKFVAADGDIAASSAFSMKAPAGYKNITPITSLIQARIDTLVASDTNDTNKSAVMALALTQISAALGIAEDSLKNVDPMDAVATDPAYALVNAMLGQAVTDGDLTNIATSLATATAATDAVSALRNIATGATISAAYFTSAADQFAADSTMINSVASMNLDATRTNTSAAATGFAPVLLTAGTADINVTAINIDSVAVDTLLSSGAKVGFTSLDSTTLGLAASTDKNTTAKGVTLAIKIGAQESRVNADANISSLTILVPMEINNTVDATQYMNAAVSGTVTWEGVLSSGATFSGEMNSSTFTDATYGLATPVEVSANTAGTATMTLQIGSILTKIDANSTVSNILTDNSVISDLKIALVDSNSALQRTNSGTTEYWGNTAIASVKGGINVNGKSIYKNAVADSREGASIIAANALNTVTAITSENVATGLTSSLIAGNASASPVTSGTALLNTTVYVNQGSVATATMDANVSVTSADGQGTGAERNSTVTATATDANVSGFVSFVENYVTDSITTAKDNGTIKIDTTPSVTSGATGHPSTTLTFKVTDEFGKASTADYNVTYYLNRAPSAVTVESNTTLATAYAVKLMANGSLVSTTNATSFDMNDIITITDADTDTFGNVGNNTASATGAMANGTLKIIGWNIGDSANSTLATTYNVAGANASIGSGTNGSYAQLLAAGNSTYLSIYGANGSEEALRLTLDTNGSNHYKFTVLASDQANATRSRMVNGTYVNLRLEAYDAYGAETNSTSDLFFKFTKEY